MEKAASSSVEERLGRLEMEVRRWRAAGLVLALALGVIVTAAFAWQSDLDRGFILPPRGEGIRARAFLLTDRDGKVHGAWTMQGDQPVLKLYGENGKVLWVAPPRVGVKPAEAK